MAILDVFNLLFIIRDSNSIMYLLKFKGEKRAKRLLNKVFRKDKAIEVYEEFHKVIGKFSE